MSYVKATNVLPEELLKKVQEYVDGNYIYIPRKESNKKSWGELTKSKIYILERNALIFKDYSKGLSVNKLSELYFLSPKSIQRIISSFKR